MRSQCLILHEPPLPDDLRARVDVVHLFLLYRASGPAYEGYVAGAKRLFTNAAILAGSYAYDRIDYVSCAISGKKKCTVSQQLDFFRTALEIQVSLMEKGVLAGIEFFPANFGMEDQWYGWDNPRYCKPERRQECIANTKAMRQMAVQVLKTKL
jgi:hypothetical protein